MTQPLTRIDPAYKFIRSVHLREALSSIDQLQSYQVQGTTTLALLLEKVFLLPRSVLKLIKKWTTVSQDQVPTTKETL
jgi:hypothetical protein